MCSHMYAPSSLSPFRNGSPESELRPNINLTCPFAAANDFIRGYASPACEPQNVGLSDTSEGVAMRKSLFTESQIVGILKDGEAGRP